MQQPQTPAVELREVCKQFAGTRVLNGASFAVQAGETFALVGINGAGKTTCIKSILDFTSVDSGDIRIGGINHRNPKARSPVFFLPERFVPPGFMTGHDYLRHACRLHGQPYSEETVRTTVDALELGREALARPVRTFSKGMAQKLGLAAAFASGRPLLVLDEPMSGLDPKARILVKRQLAAERDAGRTVFLTTHMLIDVQALCDRMAVLHDGRAVFEGSPEACAAGYGGGDLENAFLNCLEAESAPVR